VNAAARSGEEPKKIVVSNEMGRDARLAKKKAPTQAGL
jgi:hypothetical protein